MFMTMRGFVTAYFDGNERDVISTTVHRPLHNTGTQPTDWMEKSKPELLGICFHFSAAQRVSSKEQSQKNWLSGETKA
jgi:hypothetical protein